MAKLSYQELRDYLDFLFEKLENEAKFYNDLGDLVEFKNKYNFEKENMKNAVISEDAKILIIGMNGKGVKIRDLRGIFRSANLDDSFEIVEYENLTNFDFSSLENSIKYSDVFIGPLPHKVRGIQDTSNPLEFLVRNSEILYPKIHVLKASNQLKITKSNLKSAIADSKKFELVNMNA